MAYNFKNLNEIPTQNKPTENTTVVAFESGNPRQIPAGEFGGKGLVVDLRSYTLNGDGQPIVISDISYDPIYEAIIAGKNVVFQVQNNGVDIFSAPILSFVIPGQGFMVALSVNKELNFTNGSYHTTE